MLATPGSFWVQRLPPCTNGIDFSFLFFYTSGQCTFVEHRQNRRKEKGKKRKRREDSLQNLESPGVWGSFCFCCVGFSVGTKPRS